MAKRLILSYYIAEKWRGASAQPVSVACKKTKHRWIFGCFTHLGELWKRGMLNRIIIRAKPVVKRDKLLIVTHIQK